MNANYASYPYSAAWSICLPLVGDQTGAVKSRSEAQRLDPDKKNLLEPSAAKLQSQIYNQGNQLKYELTLTQNY